MADPAKILREQREHMKELQDALTERKGADYTARMTQLVRLVVKIELVIARADIPIPLAQGIITDLMVFGATSMRAKDGKPEDIKDFIANFDILMKRTVSAAEQFMGARGA
jgi:hypothetical protein